MQKLRASEVKILISEEFTTKKGFDSNKRQKQMEKKDAFGEEE
jgi:hypothetical protein